MDVARLPAWAEEVAEPFRSDVRFWRSVFASADALVAVIVAVAGSVVVELGVGGAWIVLPFVFPALFMARAAYAGLVSSRASRVAFPNDQASWRLAERQAVASVFRHVLLRNRLRYP
jgi:hypothetical protein